MLEHGEPHLQKSFFRMRKLELVVRIFDQILRMSERAMTRWTFQFTKNDDAIWPYIRREMFAMGEVLSEENQTSIHHGGGGCQTLEGHGIGKQRRIGSRKKWRSTACCGSDQ